MREVAHRNINFQPIAGVPHLCTRIICEAFEYSKMIPSKGFLVTVNASHNAWKGGKTVDAAMCRRYNCRFV